MHSKSIRKGGKNFTFASAEDVAILQPFSNLKLCRVYGFSQQKILIEYIMLDGVNDEEHHAHLLGKLLETFQVVSCQIGWNS